MIAFTIATKPLWDSRHSNRRFTPDHEQVKSVYVQNYNYIVLHKVHTFLRDYIRDLPRSRQFDGVEVNTFMYHKLHTLVYDFHSQPPPPLIVEVIKY